MILMNKPMAIEYKTKNMQENRAYIETALTLKKGETMEVNKDDWYGSRTPSDVMRYVMKSKNARIHLVDSNSFTWTLKRVS